MTTNTTDSQLVWVVVAIVTALLVLPALTMGFGMMGSGQMMDGAWGNGMWGASDGATGWMLVVSVGLRALFLAVLLGAGYLGYRALAGEDESADPALEELRTAYARGELSDDEYDRRRERLETEP